MKAEEHYLEYFHTTKPPQGVDVLEKDYDYRDLISFAKDFANEKLQGAADKKPSIRELHDEGTARMYSDEKRTIFINGGKYARGLYRESILDLQIKEQ